MFPPRLRWLRELLAALLVVLAASPFTAPFSTFDLTDLHAITQQADMLAAKVTADDDVAVLGAPPEALTASPVFVLVAILAVADQTSKHKIPSRILRL